MLLKHLVRRLGRTSLALTPVLLLAAFWSQAAGAQTAPGVNLYLLKKWSNTPPPAAADFDALAKENQGRLDEAARDGFKLIRILFKMSLVTPDVPPAQRDTVLRLMTEFVRDANARGIRVIVAPFGDGGTFKKDFICTKPEALAETAAAIASALPDRPAAGLEPLNEPPTGCGAHGKDGRWAAVQQMLYRKIRSVRPHLTFVAYGGDWGSLDGLLQLDPAPYRDDPNVLFTFHDYEPFVFTRQGASWASPGYKNVDGLPWPYRPEELVEVQRKALGRLSQEQGSGDGDRFSQDAEKFRNAGSPHYIAERLGQVAGWAKDNGIADNRVFIGEFGVLRPTHDASGTPRPGAGNWLADMVSAARAHGFQWAVFDLDTSFAIECGGKLCDEYRAAFK